MLWLAIRGKLKTKDCLRFFTSDATDVLCSQAKESHAHLFFSCSWASLLWSRIRSQLCINKRMSSLSSATCDLSIANKGLESRLRNVAMAITINNIWHEQNSRVFEKNRSSMDVIFRKFQVLFYTIYYFHMQDPSLLNVAQDQFIDAQYLVNGFKALVSLVVLFELLALCSVHLCYFQFSRSVALISNILTFDPKK